MNYHLFKKTVSGTKGKQTKHWYYWYYDLYGRQKRKSCKGCSTKREAEAYLSQLPPPSVASDSTISDICNYMYIPGSEHCKRREQFGKSVKLPIMLELLKLNPFHPSLRLHQFKTSSLEGYSVSINMSYRLSLELLITEKEIIHRRSSRYL